MNENTEKSLDQIEKKFWYPLYTKPRQEFKAKQELQEIGIETFLPYQTVINQWSDRKKRVNKLLFTSYIFINGTEKDRRYSLVANSILGSITFNGKASIAQDFEIEQIKRILQTNSEVFVQQGIKIGDKVTIKDGPLKDLIGIITCDVMQESLFTINIELLNRSISVKIDPKYIF